MKDLDFSPISVVDFIASAAAQWNDDYACNRKSEVMLLRGQPGGGKSSVARKLETACAFKFTRVTEINASFFDPVDIMGTPANDGVATQWKPPQWLLDLTTGINLFIIEEAMDCNDLMQNLIARLCLDRELNGVHLSEDTFIILTGNNTKDKSGARRISGKLGNRLSCFDLESRYDQWRTYAIDKKLDDLLIAFLGKRQELFHAYDADTQGTCPTPRAWEAVSYKRPDMFKNKQNEQDKSVWLLNVQARVGRAAALEYAAFRDQASRLPDLKQIFQDPANAPVPTDLDVLYIMTGALGKNATAANMDNLMIYLGRLRKEFRILTIRDAMQHTAHDPINNVTLSHSLKTWLGAEGLEVTLSL
jgi:hypothetical protein